MAPSYIKPPCSVEDCERPSAVRDWCKMHYERWRVHGSPSILLQEKKSVAGPAFLAEAVDFTGDECLEWPYSRNSSGYGQVTIDGLRRPAHRVVLERTQGPPPDPAMQACHAPVVCHNRGCVNPRHLRWATISENWEDMVPDGTAPLGAKHGSAKLTEDDVRAIRSDDRVAAVLAAEYGISQMQVSRIKRRKAWKHVL